VEELEDRLGDRMDDILPVVKSSLTLAPGLVTTNGIHLHEQPLGLGSTGPADPVPILRWMKRSMATRTSCSMTWERE
jgi:hypothetical protein